MQKKSLLYSLSAVLLWSTVATAFKLSLEGLDHIQLLFYSSLTSTIVLFLIVIFTPGLSLKKHLTKSDIKSSLLLGLLNPFLYYLVLFKAYSLLPAYEAQPLNYTWPITLSVLSAIVFKEKLKAMTIAGLLLAFSGVTLIATRGDLTGLSFGNPLGVILAVGSSIIWAVYWVINIKDRREASVKLFGAFAAGTIYSAIYLAVFSSFSVKMPLYTLGAVYVGLFEMGITFFLWMKGLSLSKNNANTSTLAYLSPFLSLIFIALILNEKIYFYSVLGLILIISGILVQQLFQQRK
ncbi:MAG: DMT family transporter [Bacillota bacterium]